MVAAMVKLGGTLNGNASFAARSTPAAIRCHASIGEYSITPGTHHASAADS